jgi:hypothetical protein
METIKTSNGEKKLTLGMITRALRLSKLQIRNFFLTVLREPMPQEDAVLSPRVLLFLLTADMFEKLAFLKPEQKTVILTELWAGLYADEHVFNRLNQLMFADSQYCTWTGRTGFLNLDTGEDVPQLPHPPMESIGYNLSELYRRGQLLIENRSGLNVKKHNAGSVDEQGNVCVGPADNVFGSVRDGSAVVGPDHNRA